MLIQKFEEIHTEKKQSLIVISHQEKIINMADRIMIIDDGEIKKIGTKMRFCLTLMVCRNATNV